MTGHATPSDPAIDATLDTAAPLVVVTGFGPFLDVIDNPSAAVVRILAEHGLGPGLRGEFAVLPTEYRAVSARLPALLALQPVAMIHLGYSRTATRLTLERRASRECSQDKADAAGFIPAPEAPGKTAAPIVNLAVDFDALLSDLAEAGIAAEPSDNAGRYVCNHTYFETLGHIRSGALTTRALFVHLPLPAEAAGTEVQAMPLAGLAQGIRVIARRLAGLA